MTSSLLLSIMDFKEDALQSGLLMTQRLQSFALLFRRFRIQGGAQHHQTYPARKATIWSEIERKRRYYARQQDAERGGEGFQHVVRVFHDHCHDLDVTVRENVSK